MQNRNLGIALAIIAALLVLLIAKLIPPPAGENKCRPGSVERLSTNC